MSSALSDLTTEYAESEQTNFIVPLQEYLQSILSIKNLITSRNERKGRYISSLLDLESKFMSCRKLEGIQGKESQLNSKQLLVERATVTLENNKNEYRKVSNSLTHDIIHLRTCSRWHINYYRNTKDTSDRRMRRWSQSLCLSCASNKIITLVRMRFGPRLRPSSRIRAISCLLLQRRGAAIYSTTLTRKNCSVYSEWRAAITCGIAGFSCSLYNTTDLNEQLRSELCISQSPRDHSLSSLSSSLSSSLIADCWDVAVYLVLRAATKSVDVFFKSDQVRRIRKYKCSEPR